MKISIGQALSPTRDINALATIRPDSDGERIASIDQITLVPEYKVPIHLY